MEKLPEYEFPLRLRVTVSIMTSGPTNVNPSGVQLFAKCVNL